MTKSLDSIRMEKLLEVDTGQALGQLRSMPVRLGNGEDKAFLAVYGADFDVDPSVNMFFYPKDTLKMMVFTAQGDILWKRDLGRTVVPGIWFCPVFAFDLDQDGADEIWYVNNIDNNHPLAVNNYRLERVDVRTGESTGQWQWPHDKGNKQPLTMTFRNFILGGYVNDKPVLVTVQGTYGQMNLQAWNPDMSNRWEYKIAPSDPGARGSHITPIVDINNDGVDEIMWGERGISLDTGEELFCGDRDSYRGHSDVIQPMLDQASGKWLYYTIRETEEEVPPRVVMFDDQGKRVWSDVDRGHMDMGWVARIGDNQRHVAMAIRIGSKTCGPDGRFHQQIEEFTYDALTGTPIKLPYSVYRTIPVDLNGDGYHEFVRGMPTGDGELFDRHGHSFGNVGGTVAMAAKFLDLPGEQILSFSKDGKISIWADRHAQDSPEALRRYQHPYYQRSISLYGVGYNLFLCTGL